jgi:hypothetical protein
MKANPLLAVLDKLFPGKDGDMRGKMGIYSTLTARKFVARDKTLSAEFLAAHPHNLFPEYWKEDKKSRRVSFKSITTAYCEYLALMHETEAAGIGDFKYHDSGIGTTAENITDTGLGTPWGGSRDVGTQVSSGVTYTSVATTTYNASKAITEHGLFNASSGVTLMDRSVFAAINVVDTNQIEWTYVITFVAGG